MDEIKKLEKQIFDKNYVNKIPFEFFDFLAGLIVTPDGIDTEIPSGEVETFFLTNKNDLILKLKDKINEVFDTSYTYFWQAYTKLFFSRYADSFKKNATYSVRRIQTPEEYSLVPQVGIENFEDKIYVAFEIDKYIPKFDNGEIDFDTLVEREKKEHNILAFFSSITSIHFLSKIIWELFKEKTSRSFVHYRFVYGRELEDLVLELSFETLFFFAKTIYRSVNEEFNFNYVIDTVTEYYIKTTVADSFKFSGDMEQLEETLNEVFDKHFNKMDQLTDETKDDLLVEFVHIILAFIESGLAFPEYFYEIKYREASDFDKQDYRVQYAFDLYNYMDNGMISPNILESYGFIITDDSMRTALEESFLNEHLLKRFLELDR